VFRETFSRKGLQAVQLVGRSAKAVACPNRIISKLVLRQYLKQD